MIREYLEKTKDEFLEQRANLLEEIHLYDQKMKENMQFIQILENENDSNFEAFTPREVNVFNKKKIAELQENQKEISDQIVILRDKLGVLDCKIDEITSVIQVAEEDVSDSSNSSEKIDAKVKMSILQTVERERQRIACNLHDTTTQKLTSLIQKTELCSKWMDVDPVRCKLELLSICDLLENLIDEMRQLIFDLQPMSMDDMGFDVTVNRFLEKFKFSNDIKCNYYIEGEPFNVELLVQLTLFYIIQEACNNTSKHADASQLDIHLIYEENSLSLKIIDDGKGFDVNSIPTTARDDNSGFGILMMKDRVYLLSGSFDIVSSPGNGCSVLVTIPV